MMSKPAYLSVEIVTDKPTSSKISIPQVVSVLSKLDCPLPGRKSSIYVNMLVYQLCILQIFISTSFKKYISCLGPGPSSCKDTS